MFKAWSFIGLYVKTEGRGPSTVSTRFCGLLEYACVGTTKGEHGLTTDDTRLIL